MGVRARISAAAAVGALALVLLAALSPCALAAYPGDNGRIAFVSNRDDTNIGNLEIYTIDADGSDLVRLTTHRYPDDEPVWSPDGTRIAYAGHLGDDSGVIVMNADGSGKVKVSGAGTFYYPSGHPTWSPDGRQIVYQLYEDDSGRTDLHVVNADGSGDRKLTDTPTIGEIDPAWSPDGSKLSFSHFVPPCVGHVCNFELFVMNLDGTGKTRLTFDDEQDSDADWSPDGKRLAYEKIGETFGGRIQVINADGTGDTNFSPTASGYEPAWSPDGRYLLFSHYFGLTYMNPDGTDRRFVLDSRQFHSGPNWQPIPNQPPDCSHVAADPSVLLPANRKLVTVDLFGASDPDGDQVSITIDGVTQDEPVTANGDPTTPDAATGSTPENVDLRAERNPNGDGRVYTIAFTASDGRGGSCSGKATVSVPRHKDDPAVDSAPPSFDSFGS